MATQMRGEALIDRVAAEAFGGRMNDRAFCYDGDVCGASTYIYDRGGPFVGRQNTRAESGRQALFHHKYLAYMGVLSGIKKCPLLDVRDVRGEAHHRLYRNARAARFCFFYKM